MFDGQGGSDEIKKGARLPSTDQFSASAEAEIPFGKKKGKKIYFPRVIKITPVLIFQLPGRNGFLIVTLCSRN